MLWMMADILQFSSFFSSDCIFMKCLLDEDSNCNQSMTQKSIFTASQQTGPTSKLGCWFSAQSAEILGEKPLILFDVSTADKLSTKSLMDQYSSSIRAGGKSQIARERFTSRDGPADDSSWSQLCDMTIQLNICSCFAGRSFPVVRFEASVLSWSAICWLASWFCPFCCHLGG